MRNDGRPHTLYRFFDAADVLLYVGLTAEPDVRWKSHSTTKPWWSEAVRSTMEHFPDRSSVKIAERHAIKTERPLHNVAHIRPYAYAAQTSHPALGDLADTDASSTPTIADVRRLGTPLPADSFFLGRDRHTDEWTVHLDVGPPGFFGQSGHTWGRRSIAVSVSSARGRELNADQEAASARRRQP